MTEYPSVTAYTAARRAGDSDTASAICREVIDRFETRTTDGTELAHLYEANQTTPLASD
ncbi:hypothetical protein ACWF94_38770 [Streptomyces sp. NPDC055078]